MITITNRKITSLQDNEIFVFGSNEAGRHGKGAAKLALQWGAIYYNPEGLQGNTYALPTMDKYIDKLPVPKIAEYVNNLLETIKQHPEKHFLITEIGCGLAGNKHVDIAPLFKDFLELPNISLPQKFIDILTSN